MNAGRLGSSEHEVSRPSAIWILLLVGSAALGTVLRLDGFGSSLWLDEFGTLWTVEGTLLETWRRATSFQGQTPFYYTFAWISVNLFGESEIALRLPSLLFGLAAWLVLGFGSLKLFGPRAGLCAYLLAAVDPTLIHASADARPYALAFLMLALAILGFLVSCSKASRGARALWVFCGAATIWSHYVFYPFVLGMVGTYLLVPDLRARYRPSQFGLDSLIHLLLVAFAVPQFTQLFARRSVLDWVSTGYTGGGLLTATLPYWPLLALGMLAVWQRNDSEKILFRALWISLLIGALGFLLLNVLGANVIHWRYTQGGLIIIILLSAASFAVVNRYAAAVAIVVGALLLVTALERARSAYGTYTLKGFEDWRQATEVLGATLGGDTRTPVLFRSGFREENDAPLGSPVTTTRAPLRGPGRVAPNWHIVPLTASWDHPEREAYFADEVLPQLDGTDTFYLLSRSRSYAANLVEWVDEARPGSFESRTQVFGRVVLITFIRTPSSRF